MLGKRGELLKEVVPKVSRFAFLDDDELRDQTRDKWLRESQFHHMEHTS